MQLSYRLTMMILSLAIILTIGWLGTGSFAFAAGQFWFIAGALLLITQSLVDQPNFSKDANIFLNGLTAFVSLFTVLEAERSGMWNVFFAWSVYLVISSFILMALRSRELALEKKSIQFFSRLNRTIGRPESIFSAFFLWGALLQFSSGNNGMILNPKIIIRINGRPIHPWDPFLSDHPATWSSPVVKFPAAGGMVEVQCHVLPHKDKLDPREHDIAAGPDGWTAQQGFYVYRNERLLLAGSWLGLGQGRSWTKEEAHRLARIRLDISNTADSEWKIDIRKSTARPPVLIRSRLTRL